MRVTKASISSIYALLLLAAAGRVHAQNSSYYDLTSDDSDFYFDDYSDVEDYENCPSYTTVVDDIYALNLGSSGEGYYPDTAVAQMAISNGDYGTWQMNHYISWFGTRPAGNCGLVTHYQAIYSVPIEHIWAYYYFTNSYSKTNGKYIGAYKRCNPIGTTCDNCTIIIGSPPFAPYGLFDGAEIHILSVGVCSMALDEALTQCYSPDPIPGGGGGTAKVRFPKDKPLPTLPTADAIASVVQRK